MPRLPASTTIGRIDLFLLSDVNGGWAKIDGMPAPAPPSRTFIMTPGDHVVTIGARGFKSCRFTLRDVEVGQSVTVHADLTIAKDRGCGRISASSQLGRMAPLKPL